MEGTEHMSKQDIMRRADAGSLAKPGVIYGAPHSLPISAMHSIAIRG